MTWYYLIRYTESKGLIEIIPYVIADVIMYSLLAINLI